MLRFHNLIRMIWQYVREACGENDYARYQARALGRGEPSMPRDDFYLAQLRRKYSTVSRCC